MKKIETSTKLQFFFNSKFFLLFRHFNRLRKDQRLFTSFFLLLFSFKELCFDYKFAIKILRFFFFIFIKKSTTTRERRDKLFTNFCNLAWVARKVFAFSVFIQFISLSCGRRGVKEYDVAYLCSLHPAPKKLAQKSYEAQD